MPPQHAHVRSDVGQIARCSAHRRTPVPARNPPRGHVGNGLLLPGTVRIEPGGGHSQLLSHVQVGNNSELNCHLLVDGTGVHGRDIEVGEGRERLVYLGLEELAERLAVDEWLAGRVLGRVVVDHLVLRTVHLLELFNQGAQVGNAHSSWSNALLSDTPDVLNDDVGVGQEPTIVEQEVRGSDVLEATVAGIDAEIRKQCVFQRNSRQHLGVDAYMNMDVRQ